MTNLVYYHNKYETLGGASFREKIAFGRYGGPELRQEGREALPRVPNVVWVPDLEIITTSISIEVVGDQLVARPEEDDFIYFLVAGARGGGHNNHKTLLVPAEGEILAAGGETDHQRGSCNKITTALFRLPKGSKRVIVYDLYEYGSAQSDALIFTVDADGEWGVRKEPYERFQALKMADA